MTTVAEVQSAIRARAEANFMAVPLRFKNEDALLPDVPTAFAFVELIIEDHGLVAFGGGAGANMQRTSGRIEAQFLVPIGTGADDGLTDAETFAAVFRAKSLSGITYRGAEVYPGAGKSDDGSYDLAATVIIDLHFYKTG